MVKKMKKLLSIGLVSLGLLSTSNATELPFKPYVGLEIGSTSINSDYKVFDEDPYMSLKANVGFRYEKYFGAEVSYEGSSENDVTFNSGLKNTASFRSYGIDALGYLPVNESLDFIGSLGLAKYDFDVEWRDLTDSGKTSKSKTAFRVGLGAQFNVNKNVGFTLMAKYIPIKIEDEGYDFVNGMFNLSLGAKFSF